MSDLISRQVAVNAILKRQCVIKDLETIEPLMLIDDILALPSAEPVQLHQVDCTGCKFVGTYDTDFPCTNCLRKTKDYYCEATMDGKRREK